MIQKNRHGAQEAQILQVHFVIDKKPLPSSARERSAYGVVVASMAEDLPLDENMG